MTTQAVEIPVKQRSRVAEWLLKNLLAAVVLTAITTGVSVLVTGALAPDTRALEVRAQALEEQLHFTAAQDVLDRFDRVIGEFRADPKPTACERAAYARAITGRRKADALYLRRSWGPAAALYQRLFRELIASTGSCPGRGSAHPGPTPDLPVPIG